MCGRHSTKDHHPICPISAPTCVPIDIGCIYTDLNILTHSVFKVVKNRDFILDIKTLFFQNFVVILIRTVSWTVQGRESRARQNCHYTYYTNLYIYNIQLYCP